MYEGTCLSLLVCKSDKKLKLVVYYVNLIIGSNCRECPGRDFLNDAPFEDLEKILEILRYKVQDILYFEPYVAFFFSSRH